MKNKNNQTRRKAAHRWWLLLATLLLLPASCINEQVETTPPQAGPLEVRLLVNTRQAGTTRAEGDDTDVSNIHELRVYVYNAEGKTVAHYYNPSLSATGQAYYVPLRLSEGGMLDFYVVANESSAGITSLDENTTEETLLATPFNKPAAFNNNHDFLMTGKALKQEVIADAVTIVECPLTRDFSELNIYFAKTSEVDVTVRGVLMYDYTNQDKLSFLGTGETSNETTDAITNTSQQLWLLGTAINVTTVIQETDQENPSVYGDVVITHPLLRNTYGNEKAADWETAPETTIKPRLNVSYTIDNPDVIKTKDIYLPAIPRNCRCNIYCLVKSGDLVLNVIVEDWKEETWELGDFMHPSYQQPLLPFGTDLSKLDKLELTEHKAEIWYEPSGAGAFKALFRLTDPEGLKWTITLFDADPNEFERKVYKLNDPNETEITEPTASEDWYVIQVTPKEDVEEDVEKTVKLGITYVPQWDLPENETMFLLLNKTLPAGGTFWPTGADNSNETIIITQVKRPTDDDSTSTDDDNTTND